MAAALEEAHHEVFFNHPLTLLLATTCAIAAEKTITLDVSDMTCTACPITVKKALNKVPGASRVNVSLERNRLL